MRLLNAGSLRPAKVRPECVRHYFIAKPPCSHIFAITIAMLPDRKPDLDEHIRIHKILRRSHSHASVRFSIRLPVLRAFNPPTYLIQPAGSWCVHLAKRQPPSLSTRSVSRLRMVGRYAGSSGDVYSKLWAMWGVNRDISSFVVRHIVCVKESSVCNDIKEELCQSNEGE